MNVASEFEMLDSEQVAHLLNCSMRTLWRIVAKEEFPQPIRFSRKMVRWDGGTVRRWLIEKGMTTLPAGKVAAPATGPDAPSPRRLYKARTLARMLQVSLTTLYRMAPRFGLERRAVGHGYALSDAQLEALRSAAVLPAEEVPC